MLQNVQNATTVTQRTLFPGANQKQTDNSKETSWFARHPKTKAALKGAALGLSAAASGAVLLFSSSNPSLTLISAIGGGIGAVFGVTSAPKDSDGKRNKWAMLSLALLGGVTGGAISAFSAGFLAMGALGGDNLIPPVLTLATGGSAVGGVIVNTVANSFKKTE